MKLLNFGCGSTFHPDWVNLDAAPVSTQVIAHDLRRGFPFADETFDVVYGSHVLEHLEPAEAIRVLRECIRVLKPNGIVRVVVPDLETIVRLYLNSLEGALAGDKDAQVRYDWMILELYDQTVRKSSGGEMGIYLASKLDQKQASFVASRIGDEGTCRTSGPGASSTLPRFLYRRGRTAISKLRRLVAGACAFLILGTEGWRALSEGMFRRSGEVHQWMYDRLSMRRTLERAGFTGIRSCVAGESDIFEFAGYQLETWNGQVRKPDSLFMEGRKPASVSIIPGSKIRHR